jgi:alpha,alpha-trehalose phosphorylase
MIGPGVLTVEPWAISERQLHLDLLAQTESLFALSNGHIGLRGNLDEGEPHSTPGSYLNGCFETLPLPYAESGYGYPEEGQSLINIPNGKLLRLLVDDEPLDVRYGKLRRHERVLDLRDGVLRRELEWVSPAGQAVRVRSTRLVSFVQRAVAAICYEVEALDEPTRIVLQSALVANEPLPEQSHDPRAAVALRAPLIGEYHTRNGLRAALGHRTRLSGLRMSAGLDHVVEGPQGTVTEAESWPDLARVTVSTELAPGQRLKVVKLLAYGWSSVRSMPALRDQVDAALSAAERTGWDGLLAGQRRYLDDVWERADVEVDGDPALQQAMRFAVFQTVQAAARAEGRAIPAKGLTGRGYDGHTFWDLEAYLLPVLTYTAPAAARDALEWRHGTLTMARDRARELRLQGAAFPWRTISGKECSGYWPASTAAFHINADIADAVRRYVAATGDTDFESGPGLELLVETARLWRALGHHDAAGCFRIDGVTGPDEYSALADNNTFTNLMAARNLRAAAAVAARHPQRAAELGVIGPELDAWRKAADAMVVPFDHELGVTAQSEGFTRYRPWDFAAMRPEDYPLLLHVPYGLLYSSQVVKQADLVLALYLCGDHFSAEQKRKDFDYYEAITARDSSLSASIQAIVAAEVGHLELAYDYFRESALIDLRDVAGNTADGLHLASLAGSWLAAVAGFGGLRDHGDRLSFAPRLPADLTGLSFRLVYRGRRIRVDLGRDAVCYRLLAGDELEFLHHGEPVRLAPDGPETRAYPPLTKPPAVRPPVGRAPLREGVGADAGDPGMVVPHRPPVQPEVQREVQPEVQPQAASAVNPQSEDAAGFQ